MGLAQDRMRNYSGCAIYVFGHLVQWSSKMQTIAAGSTFEAELIAASSASDKSLWFYHLMESLPFLFSIKRPVSVPMFIDNMAALSVSNHPNSSTKSRHVALREFRIRDHHEANKIRPFFCPGPLNVSDFFTKVLQKTLFNVALGRLGVTGNHHVAPQAEYNFTRPVENWLDPSHSKNWKLFHVFQGRIEY
jgi:hypothetical protein